MPIKFDVEYHITDGIVEAFKNFLEDHMGEIEWAHIEHTEKTGEFRFLFRAKVFDVKVIGHQYDDKEIKEEQ